VKPEKPIDGLFNRYIDGKIESDDIDQLNILL